MKAKRMLAVCLALVMVATMIVAVACDSHTHNYTKWNHNDTEHWKECEKEGDIDVSTKAKHSFGTDGKCECGAEQTQGHKHSYTKWANNEEEHWKVCPADGVADNSTKAPHNFVEGACECGATESGPVVDLDTRVFYVIGSGASAGSLGECGWSGCMEELKFTKAEAADADGNTVYTIELTLYTDDNFKIIQDVTIDPDTSAWDDSTVLYFNDLSAPTGSFTEGSGGNIITAANGRYKFTIRTTLGGDLYANKVEVECLETLPDLGFEDQYEMYLVGSIASAPDCGWPGVVGKDNVPSKCVKMTYNAASQTFTVDVVLAVGDEFKVYNLKNDWYSDGSNFTVSTPGTYRVTYSVSDNSVTVVAVPAE